MLDTNKINETYQLLLDSRSGQKQKEFKYRLKKLDRLKQEILGMRKEIEAALLEDLGKSAAETNLTEILPIIGAINMYKKNGKAWLSDKRVGQSILFKGAKSYISYEPKGICLVIGPWNYPFQLTIYPILTSFLAGNTTLLKPSEYVPATNKVIIKLLQKVFTLAEVGVCEGEVETSTFLLEKKFDHIFFTGSTPVGKVVMEKASAHLTSVTLELGGKSPVVIDKDFSIEKACEKIVWGKLVNAGQTCVAPDYIFIPKGKKEEFSSAFEKYALKYYLKNKKQSDYCSIISERHYKRLEEICEDASIKGAIIVKVGEDLDQKFAPRLISKLSEDMKVMEEEIFGPLFPIFEYEQIENVIEFINKRDYPLSLYCFSNSKKWIQNLQMNTTSGGFVANDVLLHVGNPELAFGGIGPSGTGRYHGPEGLLEFSNQRTIMIRKKDWGLKYFFPPYTAVKRGLINTILKRFSNWI